MLRDDQYPLLDAITSDRFEMMAFIMFSRPCPCSSKCNYGIRYEAQRPFVFGLVIAPGQTAYHDRPAHIHRM